MDWKHNTIWFEQLPPTTLRSVDFGNRGESGTSLVGGQYLRVRGFKSRVKTFEDFPANGSVKFLDLILSNVTSFKGVSVLGQVKRIETYYCLKLERDEGLAEVADSLEWLHINQSKKFQIGESLLGLSGLRVLCLNSCGPLADLEFLARFPKLLDFRFVDTNVVSGDLSPLLRHPTLCSVGFLNKRHYNARDTEIEEQFSKRRSESRIVVRKGQFETFRYAAMES